MKRHRQNSLFSSFLVYSSLGLYQHRRRPYTTRGKNFSIPPLQIPQNTALKIALFHFEIQEEFHGPCMALFSFFPLPAAVFVPRPRGKGHGYQRFFFFFFFSWERTVCCTFCVRVVLGVALVPPPPQGGRGRCFPTRERRGKGKGPFLHFHSSPPAWEN